MECSEIINTSCYPTFTNDILQHDNINADSNSNYKIVKGTGKTGTKRVRSSMDRGSNSVIKKIKKCNDCEITHTEGTIHRPSVTEWPNYRYHQIDEIWQRNACIRMGLQFKRVFRCQSSGGSNVTLTRPNKRTLRNVLGDGNCLFRALSYIITGTESQHINVRNAILQYMCTIESLLVGYDDSGNYNYLQPFGHASVQNYIDSTHMDRANTWGSELEMICLSHMLSTIVYSYEASSNSWQVFSYNFIDRSMACDYTSKSIYLWFEHSHFKVVTSIRRG